MHSIPIADITQGFQPDDFPTVRIGEELIPAESIAREMQQHPGASLKEAWEAAARSLVVRHLMQRRAAELALDNEADEQAQLASLLDHELQIEPPDEATCRRYHQQNPERFTSSPLVAARHILLAAAPDDITARDQQRDLGLALLQQLQTAPDIFDELALRHSACESRLQGGQLGQISKGQTVAEFEQQVFNLPEGLHSQLIESRYGYHLVIIDQHVDGELLPYEAVAERIKNYLSEKATRTAIHDYLHRLAEQAEVTGITLN